MPKPGAAFPADEFSLIGQINLKTGNPLKQKSETDAAVSTIAKKNIFNRLVR